MSFDEKYFSTNTYKNVSYAEYSQYWWSNRFFAILARRFGLRGTRLLEIGSGLGHLVGQLDEYFLTTAVEVNHWALVQSKTVAPRTSLQVASAENLPFPDGTFGVMAQAGVLILATPNLASLSRSWKGEKWIGYQDLTHISLKPPREWLGMINSVGFKVKRVVSDGFWDVPYIPVLPKILQKLIFGSLGGLQAVSGLVFLPIRWGESILVIASKQ
jgi:hypothetical protein